MEIRHLAQGGLVIPLTSFHINGKHIVALLDIGDEDVGEDMNDITHCSVESIFAEFYATSTVCGSIDCARVVDMYILARRDLIDFNRRTMLRLYIEIANRCDMMITQIITNYAFANISKNGAGVLAYLRNISASGFNPMIIGGLYEDMCYIESDKRFVHAKARTIQRKFRAAIADPQHPMCYRRLMYEFETMSNELVV